MCLIVYFSNQMIALGFYRILFRNNCLNSNKFTFEIIFEKNTCDKLIVKHFPLKSPKTNDI